ncbi:MAG: hypothetical protein IPL38_01385 [Rhodobacter sp.]|jgi:hypothetical protein|nr:hypothetical protein [Rhodobacter sp.]MBK8438206.1 hypothetical protein [Rhodobacter sp.]
MKKTTVLNALRLIISTLPFASTAHAAMPVPMSPWDIAQREDCVQAYARFVLQNPDSVHVDEALCRLATLETLAANVTARVAPVITAEMRSADGAMRLMNI